MTEKENSGNYDDRTRELLALSRARLASGRPEAGEVAFFTGFELPELKKTIAKESILEDYSIKKIEEFKQECDRESGVPISRIILCGDIVLSIGQKVAELAREALNASNMADFNFYYDFHRGMSVVINGLGEAESKRLGQYEKEASEALSNMVQIENMGPVEETEIYFSLIKGATENSKLLKDDISGFSLADRLVNDVKENIPMIGVGRDIEPVEYLTAGAQTAANYYKKFYRLVKPLYEKS